MASLRSRAAAYRQSPHYRRLFRFLSVSIISTIITQVVLFLTYHVWSVASAMECNVIATACATFPAYYLNRTWTWGKSGKSHVWREVVPFWSIAFVGLVLSTLAVGFAAHNANHISHSRDVRAAFVQLANLVTYGFIWIGRYTIFNRYLFGDRTQQTSETAANSAGTVSTVGTAPEPSDGMPLSQAAQAAIAEELVAQPVEASESHMTLPTSDVLSPGL
jgi:putative flippase GtrA